MSKRMLNERFIKWLYYFLYLCNMIILVRGYKVYRVWDIVMMYNYYVFIFCLVILLIILVWKKIVSVLIVFEIINNLYNIIDF